LLFLEFKETFLLCKKRFACFDFLRPRQAGDSSGRFAPLRMTAIRKTECGKQKTEFVKICFFVNFRDSTHSNFRGFFGRHSQPQNDGVGFFGVLYV